MLWYGSSECFQSSVIQLGRICKERSCELTGKKQFYGCGKRWDAPQAEIEMRRETVAIVGSFKYLGSCFSKDGGL